MGILYVFASALVEPFGRRRRRGPTVGQLIARPYKRRRAEKRYVKNAVRRMELNAQARAIYAARNPKPTPWTQVVDGASPTSRYGNPDFWQNRTRQPKPPGGYKDPRDFWSFGH